MPHHQNHIQEGRLNYQEYLVFRGYDISAGKVNILKRALIESWGEPGFHRFWQVWNPGIGHLFYRLYVFLVGKRFRILSTLLVFVVCGIAHDAVVSALFLHPYLVFTGVFSLFGVCTIASRALEPILRQEKWPCLINAALNLMLLGVSIFLAVQLQMKLFP